MDSGTAAHVMAHARRRRRPLQRRTVLRRLLLLILLLRTRPWRRRRRRVRPLWWRDILRGRRRRRRIPHRSRLLLMRRRLRHHLLGLRQLLCHWCLREILLMRQRTLWIKLIGAVSRSWSNARCLNVDAHQSLQDTDAAHTAEQGKMEQPEQDGATRA